MLELMLCSMLTLLPDFLFRRFVQGKRLGKEITLFSVWYELRWGITLCLILTVLLITVVLYNHPSSKDVNALFRTISIFAETGGRVSEVYVGYNEKVKKGQPLFKIDSKRQEAEIETARARVVEVEAGMGTAKADVLTSQGKLDEAKGDYQQALDEYNTKKKLYERNPDVVATRELEKLQTLVAAAARQRRRCECHQTVGRDAPFDRPAGAEGERGGAACGSPGRAGENDGPCRRRRTGRSVRPEAGRHRAAGAGHPGRGDSRSPRPRAKGGCSPDSTRSKPR